MAKQKKGGGFFKGLFIYMLGISTGIMGAAILAAYINKLHLPFIDVSPTRDLSTISNKDGDDNTQSEDFVFRDLLTSNNEVATIVPAEDAQLPKAEHQFEFYLQIGAFRNKETAENLRGKVILSGHAAIIKVGNLSDGSILHRLWVGPYTKKDDAEQVQAQLALNGFQDISLLQISL